MTSAAAYPKDNEQYGLDASPWWRQTYCWLVIIGPLVVVIAGLTTAVIAFRSADALAPEYVSDHLQASRKARLAASMQPAEAVSNGEALHPPTAKQVH